MRKFYGACNVPEQTITYLPRLLQAYYGPVVAACLRVFKPKQLSIRERHEQNCRHLSCPVQLFLTICPITLPAPLLGAHDAYPARSGLWPCAQSPMKPATTFSGNYAFATSSTITCFGPTQRAQRGWQRLAIVVQAQRNHRLAHLVHAIAARLVFGGMKARGGRTYPPTVLLAKFIAHFCLVPVFEKSFRC